MKDVRKLAQKAVKTLKEEGVLAVTDKVKRFVSIQRKIGKTEKEGVFCDVLFINGCAPSVPHPSRYRISHQREQLFAYNISSNEVYYEKLKEDMVCFYRVFIFFRCPHTETIEAFIKLAKELNKKVLFDVDDLVIDTKYTDAIPYLSRLKEAERAQYDEGVRRMGRTLQLCDGAITTTQRLKTELEQYVPEVLINRNIASEEMVMLSEKALKNVTKLSEKISQEAGNLSDKSAEEKGELSEKALPDAGQEKKVEQECIHLGYFSGSLTHNQDFRLILSPLCQVMKDYPHVKLNLVGELELPVELKAFNQQVVIHPFMDWRKLPGLIAQMDINLAPLEATIFNEAKSENKWVEAALVKVPTIASKVGAFAWMIEEGETGLLCEGEEDWKQALITLITDPVKRGEIGEAAYRYCMDHCVSISTGSSLARFIKETRTTNIAFVLPGFRMSGGVRIVLHHAAILQKAGMDVVLININASAKANDKTDWYAYGSRRFPVLWNNRRKLAGRFDKAVATMWTTTRFLEEYPNIETRAYLVQNFETDFYSAKEDKRILANASYSPIVATEFLTISKWCKQWLQEKYGQVAKYAPNGINKADFPHEKRDFSGKIRILIEGDCSVAYKNVDEAFAVVNQLDLSKFEIWYMSYNVAPKPHYHVDRFLSHIPYEEVPNVYRQCHILLKTSILESFSLPPLEMMATGGYVVVVPNGGNQEYLIHEENCLLYPQGNIEAAVLAIHRICSEEELRERLFRQGVETAEQRDWERIRDDVVSLYLP